MGGVGGLRPPKVWKIQLHLENLTVDFEFFLKINLVNSIF